eukprot:CAMPEP_0197021450 /NCGR_PEP_ID=MMETSP1384-20130603/2321_1 /TAXON_ID=29189 /ORGANISM="Ammonia sp." /LENGTH=1060 /DNA_ID=CAMNT_0042449277 /DNA_START=38 /DNA_END=3220 /DNA_ORIENTATION=+
MTSEQEQIVLNLLDSVVSGKNIQSAEQKLCEISQFNGYAMLLLSIFCNNNLSASIRHQSGILLKNFLISNWENNRIAEKEKESVKRVILNESLLQDCNSQIRETTALIISHLTEYDYPEKWSNLFDTILAFTNKACKNCNLLLLSGSVKTLKYFMEHISHLQLTQIVPMLFPILYSILAQKSMQNMAIRVDLLSIYQHLITLMFDTLEVGTIKKLMDSTVYQYLQYINDDVLCDRQPTAANLELQTLGLSIVNDITSSSCCYYKVLINVDGLLQNLLTSTWNLMLFYQRQLQTPSAPDIDSNFYATGFKWFWSILKHKNHEINCMLDDKLNNICMLMIKLLQFREEDMESFTHSPNDFLLNDEHPHYDTSVRAIVRNVLTQFLELRPRTGYDSLLQCTKRNVVADNVEWTQREANLLVFGYLAHSYGRKRSKHRRKQSKADFKMEEFLQQTLWKDVHRNDGNPQHAVLKYRALCTLNKFMSCLNLNAKKHILPQIVASMKTTHSVCIRYAAVKCFESMLACNDDIISLNGIETMLNAIIPLICHLLTKLNELTIAFVLRSLYCILHCIDTHRVQVNNLEADLVPLIISLWSQYCLHQEITSEIKQIIALYHRQHANVGGMITPSILQILNNKNCDSCVVHNALEVLLILLQDTHKEREQELHVYYTQFLPLILDLVYCSTDSEIMNTGAKVLCVLISKNASFIQSNSGLLEYICKIISKFLSLQIPETASIGIGPLIVQLIVNLKCTLNDAMFTDLLLTILAKMNKCRHNSLKNELLLIFARLIHEDDNLQILQFLAKHHKLDNMLTLWCSNHNDFIYPYYKKLSVTALAKILDSTFGNENVYRLLQNMQFDGYPIINLNAPRSSRSKKQTLQYTKMSFVAKFFQLLVETFQDLVELPSNQNTDDEEEEDDEDDDDEQDGDNDDEEEEEVEDDEEYDPQCENEEDEYEDDDDDDDDEDEEEECADEDDLKQCHDAYNDNNTGLLRNTNVRSKSKLKANSLCDIELEACPEAQNDAIYHMDFKQWAIEYSKRISAKHAQLLQGVVTMLNDKDRRVLQQILR